jgi:hypothetical protein
MCDKCATDPVQEGQKVLTNDRQFLRKMATSLKTDLGVTDGNSLHAVQAWAMASKMFAEKPVTDLAMLLSAALIELAFGDTTPDHSDTDTDTSDQPIGMYL